MKNMSIRWKILSGVVIINLLGALAVVVYEHESYSSGLDDDAVLELTYSIAAWENIQELSPTKVTADASFVASNPDWLERMKEQSGVDYFLLLDKEQIDAEAYASTREQAGLADNWDEQDTYVVALATDEQMATQYPFNVPPGDVPEMGKLIGIENGACSRTCHGSLTAEGDYWSVAWRDDGLSKAHGVFPVTDAQGATIGTVYSVQDISPNADGALHSMLRTLEVIAVTLLIATLVIGGMLDALVFKRLERMITSIEDISMRVAGGDFEAHYEPSGSTDEIGKFEKFFAQFIDLVSMTMKSLLK
jgi:HAMP domain-containing protein